MLQSSTRYTKWVTQRTIGMGGVNNKSVVHIVHTSNILKLLNLSLQKSIEEIEK